MAMIDEMRQQYPHPQSAKEVEVIGQGYCVGGALCRVAGQSEEHGHFPRVDFIVEALLCLNPRLAHVPDLATDFGRNITALNDDKDFHGAWRVAGEALAWRPDND